VTRYPQVVVVGSGFGGMQAAQSLARLGIDVLLIDRSNYHTFVPLLYQVATAQLEPESIVYSVRNLVRRSPRHLRFLLANVDRVDFRQKQLETDAGTIPYDFLVLATGSQTQYLDVSGAAEHALPLRTLPEAVALRNQLLLCFERAAQTDDWRQRQSLLTFVVVGGGATGVEVAGALVELVRHSLVRDYPTMDLRQVQILLVQAGDRLLPDLPASLGHYTYKRLRQMGVEVYLRAKVSQVSPTSVTLETGQEIAATTVIWTAGLEAALPQTLNRDIPTAIKGKVKVRSTLQLVHEPAVYAIGDVAYVEQHGKALAGVAPEALQQGVAVARNIARQQRGKAPLPFNYFNKGRLAIIGGYSGVGQIGRLPLAGFLGWFLWLSVHLVYLPGWRNRLIVFISWLQSYLLHDRSVRLIDYQSHKLAPFDSVSASSPEVKQKPKENESSPKRS
jgi:NADH:ubiquinone reductase (H+-translocating)